LAVSGGPDSLALAALARKEFKKERLVAFIVQHNLDHFGVTEDYARVQQLLADLGTVLLRVD